jgi:ATP-dependent HslUV protease ATP-binding subunit HslU
MKGRYRFGFKPPRTGRRGEAFGEGRTVTLWTRFMSFFDPTVTARTLINEGAVFGAFALW